MQDDLEKLAQRLIKDLDTPHLDKHRAEKERIDKYYSPRQCFNRWRDSDEGKAWKQQQFEIIGGKCPGCGGLPGLSCFVIDHIEPLRSHPHLATELSNLQLLCFGCNSNKGARVIG